MGGETVIGTSVQVSDEGLSPRGRGNLHCVVQAKRSAGSIPAWAGKPSDPVATGGVSAVYPRVGGET